MDRHLGVACEELPGYIPAAFRGLNACLGKRHAQWITGGAGSSRVTRVAECVQAHVGNAAVPTRLPVGNTGRAFRMKADPVEPVAVYDTGEPGPGLIEVICRAVCDDLEDCDALIGVFAYGHIAGGKKRPAETDEHQGDDRTGFSGT